ncbi:hypothetical protein PsorP6_009396 [Peronosclerospora sorghi]|uniref:Uncharacterized protein n=1 Tax=Peronosclerospora sorghi TaxID=230839 RepID=A0ACC0VYD1_9STRA|nr:hypothetical protein PsorP6_009396 [Peronosclerospora sorghi]
MTHAVVREMARSSASRRNQLCCHGKIDTDQQKSLRQRCAALSTCMDSGVALNTSSELLHFDDDDGDGT